MGTTNRISRMLKEPVSIFTRLALGIAFLSAVADRFGIWGPLGTKNVSWGNFARFTDYTRQLTSVFPPPIPLWLAWIATLGEIALGFFLIVGLRVRLTAFLSGVLLALFGLAMAIALGPEAPLNASVFSAAAAAWLLLFIEPDRLALDVVFKHRDSSFKSSHL